MNYHLLKQVASVLSPSVPFRVTDPEPKAHARFGAGSPQPCSSAYSRGACYYTFIPGEYLNVVAAIHPPVETGGLLATNFIKQKKQEKVTNILYLYKIKIN